MKVIPGNRRSRVSISSRTVCTAQERLFHLRDKKLTGKHDAKMIWPGICGLFGYVIILSENWSVFQCWLQELKSSYCKKSAKKGLKCGIKKLWICPKKKPPRRITFFFLEIWCNKNPDAYRYRTLRRSAKIPATRKENVLLMRPKSANIKTRMKGLLEEGKAPWW